VRSASTALANLWALFTALGCVLAVIITLAARWAFRERDGP
jgi:hypothetical protein